MVDGFAGVVPVMPPLRGSGIHGVMGTPGRRSSLACPGLAWVSPLGFKSYANLPGMERQSDGDMSFRGRNHVVVRSEGAGFPKVGVRASRQPWAAGISPLAKECNIERGRGDHCRVSG
jgi:hypothetical protein